MNRRISFLVPFAVSLAAPASRQQTIRKLFASYNIIVVVLVVVKTFSLWLSHRRLLFCYMETQRNTFFCLFSFVLFCYLINIYVASRHRQEPSVVTKKASPVPRLEETYVASNDSLRQPSDRPTDRPTGLLIDQNQTSVMDKARKARMALPCLVCGNSLPDVQLYTSKALWNYSCVLPYDFVHNMYMYIFP